MTAHDTTVFWTVWAVVGCCIAIAAIGLWRAATANVGEFPETDDREPTDQAVIPRYRYYVLNGDFFRGAPDSDEVTEILRAGRWVSYRGDAVEPIMMGKEINPGEIPGRAGELAELSDLQSKVSRQIGIQMTAYYPRRLYRDDAKPIKELKQILCEIDQRVEELEPRNGRPDEPDDKGHGPQ